MNILKYIKRVFENRVFHAQNILYCIHNIELKYFK